MRKTLKTLKLFDICKQISKLIFPVLDAWFWKC